MKLLSPFLILFSLTLSLSYNTETAEQKKYCNQRFNYCVQYPGELLNAQEIAINADGIFLTNEDQTIKISVAGAYNIMNWSVENLNQFYFEELSRSKPMEIELVEIHTDQTHGWVKMKYNYEVQLYKIDLLADSYIATIITVPGSSPELLKELEEQIDVSFPI